MCFREGEIDDEYDSSKHLFMHSGTRPQAIIINRPYECITYQPPAKNNPDTGQVIIIGFKCPITQNNQFSDFIQIKLGTHAFLECTCSQQDYGNP